MNKTIRQITHIFLLALLLTLSTTQLTAQQPQAQQPPPPTAETPGVQPIPVVTGTQVPEPQVVPQQVDPIVTQPQPVGAQSEVVINSAQIVTGTGAAPSVEPTAVQPELTNIGTATTGTPQPQNVQQTPQQQPPQPTPTTPQQPPQQINVQVNSNPTPQQEQVATGGTVNQPPRNPSENHNFQPSPELSAKYREEQERLAEMRRRQAELEAEQARERQQMQRKEEETYNQRSRERNQVRQAMGPDHHELPKKTVLFQVGRKIQEYYLSPMTETEISLKMIVYTLENNAYGIVKDISQSGIIKVYVYEDNTRIVGQGQFFFQKMIRFTAKARSTYVLRFYNEGIDKLISLTYPNLLQSAHLQHLYSNEKQNLHLWKTEVLGLRLVEITQRLRRNSMMDRTNNETMMSFLMRYSGYQFVEMLVVILVTGFQVHFVKRMFRSDSIL